MFIQTFKHVKKFVGNKSSWMWEDVSFFEFISVLLGAKPLHLFLCLLAKLLWWKWYEMGENQCYCKRMLSFLGEHNSFARKRKWEQRFLGERNTFAREHKWVHSFSGLPQCLCKRMQKHWNIIYLYFIKYTLIVHILLCFANALPILKEWTTHPIKHCRWQI